MAAVLGNASGQGTGLSGRICSPLNAPETELLEAIGVSPEGCRVLLRRPLTVALGRRAYMPGLAAGLLTYAVSYRHGGASLLAAAIAAVAITVSLAVHELGHLLLGRYAKGVTPRMIVLRGSGGISVIEGRYANARAAAIFAAGGPLASALATVALVLAALQLPAPYATALMLPAVLNGLMLAVNLLPVAPMDGYMLFRAAVWAGLGNREEAERRAMNWSRWLLGWAALSSLVVLIRNPPDGLVALFLVGAFALQHHAAASRRPSPLPAQHRFEGDPRP